MGLQIINLQQAEPKTTALWNIIHKPYSEEINEMGECIGIKITKKQSW